MFYGEENLAELAKVFQLVDKDHGGTISRDELCELMDTLGIKATQDELETIMMELDQNKKGEITFEAFADRMTRRVRTNVTLPALKLAIARFFGHDAQTVEFDDLVGILTQHGKKEKRLSETEATKLIYEITNVKKGKIDLILFYEYFGN